MCRAVWRVITQQCSNKLYSGKKQPSCLRCRAQSAIALRMPSHLAHSTPHIHVDVLLTHATSVHHLPHAYQASICTHGPVHTCIQAILPSTNMLTCPCQTTRSKAPTSYVLSSCNSFACQLCNNQQQQVIGEPLAVLRSLILGQQVCVLCRASMHCHIHVCVCVCVCMYVCVCVCVCVIQHCKQPDERQSKTDRGRVRRETE